MTHKSQYSLNLCGPHYANESISGDFISIRLKLLLLLLFNEFY